MSFPAGQRMAVLGQDLCAFFPCGNLTSCTFLSHPVSYSLRLASSWVCSPSPTSHASHCPHISAVTFSALEQCLCVPGATEIVLSACFTSQAWQGMPGCWEDAQSPLDPACFGVSRSLVPWEKSGWSETNVEHLLLNSCTGQLTGRAGVVLGPFSFLLILVF